MTATYSFSFEIVYSPFKLKLIVGKEIYTFGFREMIKFQNQLNQIDVEQMLHPEHRENEIIYLPSLERFLLLNIFEIIELKRILMEVQRQLYVESQLCRMVNSILVV